MESQNSPRSALSAKNPLHYAQMRKRWLRPDHIFRTILTEYSLISMLFGGTTKDWTTIRIVGIIIVHMASHPDRTPKRQALRQTGTLNPRPDRVTDELFADSDFFDPNDLLQVKYEMLRRVRRDDFTVQQAAKVFGFSRPSFYMAFLFSKREITNYPCLIRCKLKLRQCQKFYLWVSV